MNQWQVVGSLEGYQRMHINFLRKQEGEKEKQENAMTKLKDLIRQGRTNVTG